MKTYLDEVIDKALAIIESGAGKPVELARFVLPDATIAGASVQVNRWLKRQVGMNGEAALRVQAWCAVKTLEIDAGGEATREAYRAAWSKTASGKAAAKKKG